MNFGVGLASERPACPIGDCGPRDPHVAAARVGDLHGTHGAPHRHRVGRTRYKLRQQTVEPVFGIIKQAIGFRRFMLRGLEKVSLEWILVTLSYNLRRLHTLGAVLKTA